MNEFKKASVHELVNILRFVDTKALDGENLNFIIDWTTEGTNENQKYSADIIQFFLNSLEDRNG